mmetsp:Transcript_103782/g.293401  ORF Transcript_103782/g.293401 Transcript_103782/m.293401 type:complete len:175 (+) Transcript_103782:147-671(+)
MFPSTYHTDGTGRDTFVLHHGTRTSGKECHIGARDSSLVHPRQTKGRESRAVGGCFPAVGAMATRPVNTLVTPRSGPNPWSKSAYSSVYRDRHSAPAGEDFQARFEEANHVRNTLMGSPQTTPRQPSWMAVPRSTYRAHFHHGLDPEKPDDFFLASINSRSAGHTPGATPRTGL